MIEITVNGKRVTLPAVITVTELLAQLGYDQAFVAVALNRAHINRIDFANAVVEHQTNVEVLAPMAGG